LGYRLGFLSVFLRSVAGFSIFATIPALAGVPAVGGILAHHTGSSGDSPSLLFLMFSLLLAFMLLLAFLLFLFLLLLVLPLFFAIILLAFLQFLASNMLLLRTVLLTLGRASLL
jgi:hypothetical protein